jgi:ElaB/YqjD/DUF883 family membrane-anchored ribosome-binding protein
MEILLIALVVILLGMEFFMSQRHNALMSKITSIIEKLEDISSYSAATDSEKIRNTKARIKLVFKEQADDITDEYAAAVMAMNAWIWRNYTRQKLKGGNSDPNLQGEGMAQIEMNLLRERGVGLAPPKLKSYLHTLTETELRQAFATIG